MRLELRPAARVVNGYFSQSGSEQLGVGGEILNQLQMAAKQKHSYRNIFWNGHEHMDHLLMDAHLRVKVGVQAIDQQDRRRSRSFLQSQNSCKHRQGTAACLYLQPQLLRCSLPEMPRSESPDTDSP